MAHDREVAPIRHVVTVRLPPPQAFERFVDGIGEWWPPPYTWSEGALERIGIEARVDGKCFEVGPHGFRCDWGRVLAIDPPRRIEFTWQISPRREPVPDDRRASVVEVRFEAAGDAATAVRLEHRGFERHGDGARSYRDALASERGWPWILELYASQ